MRQFDNASRSRPGGKFRDITFHSRGKLRLRFEGDQILINAKDIYIYIYIIKVYKVYYKSIINIIKYIKYIIKSIYIIYILFPALVPIPEESRGRTNFAQARSGEIAQFFHAAG